VTSLRALTTLRAAIRERIERTAFPPTVAVLKGVVADGTPRCGSAVLTTTVAAVRSMVKSN